MSIRSIVFDWGDTVMRDFAKEGPMSLWDVVAWVPGAEESLQYLSQKYCCIIATSASHSGVEEMKAALSRVGADRYFNYFLASNDLGFYKPDPAFFEAVLKSSRFLPAESVMVGNLYDKDIIGAKAIGMTTVFFNESGIKGYFPAADHVISRMNDLITLF